MDKHLFHYKGSTRIILAVGVLTIGQGMAIIYQAILLSRGITNMFNGAAWTAALPILFGFLVVFLIRHLLQWIKDRIAYRFAESTATHLQFQFINKIFAIGPNAIGRFGSGNLITLCLEGTPNFRTYLELFIPRSISVACIPIMLLVYVFITDKLSGYVLVATMPIMIIFLILLGLIAKTKITAQMGTFEVLSRHFVDSLRGLVTLKYLGKSKSHEKAIEFVSNKYRMATNRTLRIAFLSTFSLDFFSSLSVAVVAVELGLRLIEGSIGLEAALGILILAPEYFQPIRILGNDYHATMNGKEAGEQIQIFLRQADMIHKEEQVIIPRWNKDSTLSIERLSKKCEDENRFILRDIGFSVNGFQKIGIIGASGSGKSTLIELLSGFTPSSRGLIEINGCKLDNFSVEAWQKQITYIPQHPYIFSGSVKENICWYSPNSTMEEIDRVLDIAGLRELVDELPNGLDEDIGQGGRSLSGGEEQRIALSRSLLQNRPIMLFDEPTAHLDIETEYEMKKMMLPLMENKLVFFATHRLHWMKDMDVILVLDAGRLIEIGTHEELYDNQGAYYQLIQAHRGEMLG